MHHCRTCCPLDVLLVEEEPQAAFLGGEGPSGLVSEPPSAFGSPMPISPLTDPTTSQPTSPALEPDADGAASPAESTPSTMGTGTPSIPPAAPSKSNQSHGSVTSRTFQGATPRSLVPVFNGFAAAATRANQLGGRFATLRPGTHTAIAKMQRQVSGSAEGGSLAVSKLQKNGVTPCKRSRSAGPGDTAASGPPSVHTVPLGREARPFPFPRGRNSMDVKASKQPRI